MSLFYHTLIANQTPSKISQIHFRKLQKLNLYFGIEESVSIKFGFMAFHCIYFIAPFHISHQRNYVWILKEKCILFPSG